MKRLTHTAAAAAIATAVAVSSGCHCYPQQAVPGCPHPMQAAFCKIENMRDGLALEKAQWRTEDDTTELRLQHAHAKVKQTKHCVDAHAKHAVRQTAATVKQTTAVAGWSLRRVFCGPWRRPAPARHTRH